jgi:hypothetical protein
MGALPPRQVQLCRAIGQAHRLRSVHTLGRLFRRVPSEHSLLVRRVPGSCLQQLRQVPRQHPFAFLEAYPCPHRLP